MNICFGWAHFYDTPPREQHNRCLRCLRCLRWLAYASVLLIAGTLAYAQPVPDDPDDETSRGVAGAGGAPPDQVSIDYDQSHALLIGVSTYDNWENLRNVEREQDQIQSLLLELGFSVSRIRNPTGKQLKDAIEKFHDDFGYSKNNRLLIYYSGHGYSPVDSRTAYLVPADSPAVVDGQEPPEEFFQLGVSVHELLTFANLVRARHVLYLLDNCYAGFIFGGEARGPGDEDPAPQNVQNVFKEKGRGFITAGTAETYDPSEFAAAFVNGLRGSANTYPDRYITAGELGRYLKSEVPNRDSRVNPDYDRVATFRGELVFPLDGNIRGQYFDLNASLPDVEPDAPPPPDKFAPLRAQLEDDPNNIDLLLILSEQLIEERGDDNIEEAEHHLGHVIRLQPTNDILKRALNLRAQARLLLQDMEGSIEDYQRASTL